MHCGRSGRMRVIGGGWPLFPLRPGCLLRAEVAWPVRVTQLAEAYPPAADSWQTSFGASSPFFAQSEVVLGRRLPICWTASGKRSSEIAASRKA
ncbi:hypothetical protein HYQ44_017889 [Verticillium longisporum]|nr:hypothetical protein HYQ44_017889 [Verticillium longisporum]